MVGQGQSSGEELTLNADETMLSKVLTMLTCVAERCVPLRSDVLDTFKLMKYSSTTTHGLIMVDLLTHVLHDWTDMDHMTIETILFDIR
mgnify:CR=1 FL=1